MREETNMDVIGLGRRDVLHRDASSSSQPRADFESHNAMPCVQVVQPTPRTGGRWRHSHAPGNTRSRRQLNLFSHNRPRKLIE
jgi:hypothetical protein